MYREVPGLLKHNKKNGVRVAQIHTLRAVVRALASVFQLRAANPASRAAAGYP
jgi:hypothetical protein